MPGDGLTVFTNHKKKGRRAPVFEPMNLRVAHVCPICTSMPVPMHPKLNGSFARNMCCMPDMWDKVMRCVRLVWLNVFDQKHPEMSPVAEVRADFEVFGTDFFWPCPSGNPYFDQIRGFITMGKVAGRWYRSKQVQTNHGVAMSGLGPNIWYPPYSPRLYMQQIAAIHEPFGRTMTN